MKPYKSLFETKRMKTETSNFIDSFSQEMISKSKRKKMTLLERIDMFSMFASMSLYSYVKSAGSIDSAIEQDTKVVWGALCEAEKRLMREPRFVNIGVNDFDYFKRIKLTGDMYKTVDKISDTCFLFDETPNVIINAFGEWVKIKSITVSKSSCLDDMSSAYKGVEKWQKQNSVSLIRDVSSAIKKSAEEDGVDISLLEKEYISVHYVGIKTEDGKETCGAWLIGGEGKETCDFIGAAIKGAFHIAMNQDCLVEQEYIEMPKSVAPMRKAKHYMMKEPSKKIKKSPHYRNLRHERFYRGEYEKLERGTRWVPVNAKFYNIED